MMFSYILLHEIIEDDYDELYREIMLQQQRRANNKSSSFIIFIKEKHKQIKPFLHEAKIYFETILTIGISVVTIIVSIIANNISNKQTTLSERQMELTKIQTELVKRQTELTEKQEKIAERQIELNEKEYRQDYFPRFILKSVEDYYDNLANIMMDNYNLESCISEYGNFNMDLFSGFDEGFFQNRDFYEFVNRSNLLKRHFFPDDFHNGTVDYPDSYNGTVDYSSSLFNENSLYIEDKEKENLNRTFNSLFYNSGKVYAIENIGANVMNLSATYFIDIRITFVHDNDFIGEFHIQLLDDNLDENYTNGNDIINVQSLNSVYYDKVVNDFIYLLKSTLEKDENKIGVVDSEYIEVKYMDIDGEYEYDYYTIENNALVKTEFDKYIKTYIFDIYDGFFENISIGFIQEERKKYIMNMVYILTISYEIVNFCASAFSSISSSFVCPRNIHRLCAYLEVRIARHTL